MDIKTIKFPYTGTQILGAILVVNTVLAGGTTQLTNLFGETMAGHILAVCTLGTGIAGGFLMRLGSMSNQFENVRALGGVDRILINGQVPPEIAAQAMDPAQAKISPASSAVAAVTATASKAAIMLLALALPFLLMPDPASAQGNLGPIGKKIANDLAGTAASKSSDALESIGAALAKPFKDLADFIGLDADGAVILATAIPTIQDGHGQQCWIEMQSFGAIVKAHPVPITFHVIQDYETLRLLGIASNRLCTNVHCTQVFADFTAMAQAASPMPLAIPSLHDLCTKVPQIAVVAPAQLPPAPATASPQ